MIQISVPPRGPTCLRGDKIQLKECPSEGPSGHISVTLCFNQKGRESKEDLCVCVSVKELVALDFWHVFVLQTKKVTTAAWPWIRQWNADTFTSLLLCPALTSSSISESPWYPGSFICDVDSLYQPYRQVSSVTGWKYWLIQNLLKGVAGGRNWTQDAITSLKVHTEELTQ